MKRSAKVALQKILPTRRPPIVVASIGRAGSTLVYDALCAGMAAARFGFASELGQRLVRDTAWDLERTQLRKGVVYKTHALASELPGGSKARVVFLYAKPSDTVKSVLSCRKRFGHQWIASHFEHMRAAGPFDALPEQDVLRLNEHISGWLNLEGTPALAMRYDGLWENQEVLSEFVGFSVKLSPRRPRISHGFVDAAVDARIAETYAQLDTEVEALPDIIYVG